MSIFLVGLVLFVGTYSIYIQPLDAPTAAIARIGSPLGAARVSLIARPMTAASAKPPEPLNDWIAVGIGLAVWAAFMFLLHDWLIGMPLL